MEEMSILLRELADKLGTTTEYLWIIMVRQAYVSAAVDLVLVLLFIPFAFFVYWVVKKAVASVFEVEDLDAGYVAVLSILVAIGMGWLLYIVISIKSIATGFFNPEAWALQEIISNLR
jgi:hypothetical protein